MILHSKTIKIHSVSDKFTDAEMMALCDAIETAYERLDLEGIVKSQFVDKDLKRIRITISDE
jgi:hypothetical protein